MEPVKIGYWVIKIGSSRPSSGTCHQVRAIRDEMLKLQCGLPMTTGEVLDVIVDPAKQGLCLRCSTTIMNGRSRR